jgi:hypothetical protein
MPAHPPDGSVKLRPITAKRGEAAVASFERPVFLRAGQAYEVRVTGSPRPNGRVRLAGFLRPKP